MNIFLGFGDLPSFNNITWEINLNDTECRNYLGLNGTDIHVDVDKQNKYGWILLTNKETMQTIHKSIAILFIVFLIIMLVPKILIDYCKSKRKLNIESIQPQNIIEQQNEENQVFQEEFVQPRENKGEPPKGFSDLAVSGAIETIEFVLGTVSNTASYLRLWALSLAHSQLAEVFFEKTIILVGNMLNNWIINGMLLIVVFPIFAGITAMVLLFMDLMECFLHTLRLQWVEFQNKFFMADGYQFKPFCFSKNIDLKEDDFEKK
jgi:V-type H+-transporting ATPase subunit a